MECQRWLRRTSRLIIIKGKIMHTITVREARKTLHHLIDNVA
jgi:hypothetical protein